ncbi:AI-2E family transporter [Methylotenera sp.]|uniref:AI-2E family transporter n=1 Tax=Methylotenera sp. TaxID=2051956 RepID=UPI002489A321|nr:AI-2E family transporter [Methylotenera sp.]MDI1297633.1 AI-2E family transporter [Methylotenera sp.]
MINTNQVTRIAIITLLVIGCIYVLQPFMAAALFAAIFCLFTWPLYYRLWLRLGKRDTLAAVTMTILLLIALILPMAFLATNLVETSDDLFNKIGSNLQSFHLQVPDWISNLPIVGEQIKQSLERATASHEDLMTLLRQYYEPMRTFTLRAVQVVVGGFVQLLLVVFVAFFFYRDGVRISQGLLIIVRRLGGALGLEMLDLSCNTVKGVMLGIFGTALAQAAVALAGFLLAGAPAPVLLACATFFLSVVPVGPPLIWGGASFWLYSQGEPSWALFLALYGLLAISTVDNVLKPILISQSSHLPILLIVFGALGGILTFGFIGIFLGPTLLAVGFTLLLHWLAVQNKKLLEVLE